MDDVFFWLRRSYLAVSHATDVALAPFGLTCAQAEVLGLLFAEDGQAQRALQDQLGVSGATLSRVVDLLVAHGFVRRAVSAEDARVKTLHLTAAGEALRAPVSAAKVAFDQQLLAGFTPPGVTTLLGGLRQLIDNVDRRAS